MSCSPRPVDSPFMPLENEPLPPESRQLLMWTLYITGVRHG